MFFVATGLSEPVRSPNAACTQARNVAVLIFLPVSAWRFLVTSRFGALVLFLGVWNGAFRWVPNRIPAGITTTPWGSTDLRFIPRGFSCGAGGSWGAPSVGDFRANVTGGEGREKNCRGERRLRDGWRGADESRREATCHARRAAS